MSTVADDSAGTEAPRRLIEAFLEAFVGGDPGAIGDLVTDDCRLHQPRWPRDTEGRAAIVEATESVEGSFTDVDMNIERAVASGDRIAALVTASGRNVGPLRMGDREVAPTGRTFSVPQFGIYHLEGDRISEAWIMADALGLVEQLDNLPSGPGKMLAIALRQLRWRLGGRRRLA